MTDTGAIESAIRKPNGDLEVTDTLGRSALLHWSRFHGLIVSAEGAVYLGQPEVKAWLLEHLAPEEPVAPTAVPRWQSRDADHIREDLRASLTFALGPESTTGEVEIMEWILESVTPESDPYESLVKVLRRFGGGQLFGAVVRFHLEARTSLMPYAENLARPASLAEHGYRVHDLWWPASVLHPAYQGAEAPLDPAFEERFAAAVEAWRQTHDVELATV